MKKWALLSLPVLLLSFLLPEQRSNHSIKMIDNYRLLNDGPYVLYSPEKVFVKSFTEENGNKILKQDSMVLADRKKILLNVHSDIPGKTFQVTLKDKLTTEKSEYKKASRQFVISDIEGNFDAFRKLLLAGKVMDEKFEWTYGDGHLVLAGDFFDRGTQVTEVLWLIYSLEDKAKKAGGYVHFVLGNHEIMNMSADLRYVHPKYMENASLMNENYNVLYGPNSELGRWLRTKNVMEKIGGVIYVHGGISRLINNIELPIAEMNALVRPFYADTTYAYPNIETDIFYSEAGPFWYRGYYTGDRTAIPQILDSTLDKFKINQVVTGHTPVADTVSSWYNGKLFNTDTPHAKGKSEALVIEG
ncbi:MAG: metallophosphoesterase, partial [Chitinophagaceae bacterium]